MAIAQPAFQVPFGQIRQRWQDAPDRTKVTVRVAVVLCMIVAAYHYSLLTLFRSLGLETPLAYVGLAPPIALLLAGLRARVSKPEVPIHDRQVDYIIGIPLLAVAMVINLVFPARLSTMFWVWRIDMFSFPFFVAGAICTVFGIRALWRQKFAVAFLFLAWPYPYQVFLLRFLNQFTNMTIDGVTHATNILNTAKVVPGTDGSLFQLQHHGRPFQISVVSACSGVNGMVGFLMVGIAFAVIVRGPRVRKLLWLASGLALLWVINVARIVFIFWTGKTWGEKVAIDVFHPFIGLLTFNLGIIAMLFALRPVGLSIDGALWQSRTKAQSEPEPSLDPPAASSSGAPPNHQLKAVPKVWVALVVVGLLGSILGVLNNDLKSYDPVANALGVPRLASFSDYPAVPDGWRAQLSDQYDWAKPYFGASSTWLRYSMFPGVSADVALKADQAVTADVISTSNLRSFSAYGVEACYRFHGYKLRDVAEVDLGGGVKGQALSFYNPKVQQDWTVVYWVWPVQTAKRVEKPTRYERVTLYVQGTANTSVSPSITAAKSASKNAATTDPGLKSIGNGLNDADPVTRKLADVRLFLVSVGRQVVHNQSTIKIGTALPTPAIPTVHSDIKEILDNAKQRRSGNTTPTTTSATVPAAKPKPFITTQSTLPPLESGVSNNP
jgi:exosortase/archaeosortase family protein